jgi:hypothetical protein
MLFYLLFYQSNIAAALSDFRESIESFEQIEQIERIAGNWPETSMI